MKMLICFLILSAIIHTYGSVRTQSNEKQLLFEEGLFEFRLNEYIIFSVTEDEGEYPLYNLYSLNVNTNKKELIDSVITLNCNVKTSDSTLVYSKSEILYRWNTHTKTKETLPLPDSIKDIIGIGYNHLVDKLLLFDFDYNDNTLRLNICDKLIKIICRKKIEFNEAEMEGIFPVIYSVGRYFIYSIQEKLFILDLSKDIPETELASDKCHGFALNDEKELLFYDLDLKKWNIINLESKGIKTNAFPDELKDVIHICPGSDLFTTCIDGRNVPACKICNDIYIYINSKWSVDPGSVIYKDDKMVVRYPRNNKNPNKECYEWELLTD